MKLTDFLSNVGRPVAYYPKMRRITGSTNATILLCQFIYWRGKEQTEDGWLYKTSFEIEDETGLSYGEQKTARRDLVSAGLMDEHYARLDHQMRFKLNLEAINSKWGTEETDIRESGKPQFGNEQKPRSLNESKITSENTTENPAGAELDMLDFELTKLPALTVRRAINQFFRLNVNWETKSAMQFEVWANGEGITAEQIERAANIWRSDKQFNWAQPTLKLIFEKWNLLMDASTPKDNDRTSMLEEL